MAESAALRQESVRALRRISEKEKELTREVWRNVEKDYEGFAVLVFKDMFSAHPTFKRFFVDVLSGDDDPFHSPRFLKHMLKVLLPTFGSVIAHLDHPEAVHEVMKRLGVEHRKKELGLRRENVNVLVQVLLEVMKLKIGYSEQQEMALTKVFTIVCNMFSNGLEGKTG